MVAGVSGDRFRGDKEVRSNRNRPEGRSVYARASLSCAITLFALCLLVPGSAFAAAYDAVDDIGIFNTDEDNQCLELDLLGNDTEGGKGWKKNEVTVLILTSPAVGALRVGEACPSGAAPMKVAYDFPDNYSDLVTFSYQVQKQGGTQVSNIANVEVQLKPLIDALALATDTPSAPTAQEGTTTPLNVTVTSDDFDGSGTATMTIASVPASATIACAACTSVTPGGSWTLVFTSNLGSSDITITDTVAATYALPIAVNWEDTDGTNIVSGGPENGTANVTIDVDVNDAPVARPL